MRLKYAEGICECSLGAGALVAIGAKFKIDTGAFDSCNQALTSDPFFKQHLFPDQPRSSLAEVR